MMKSKQYDVVIVGGGAAGFTAGMYAARQNLSTLIISKDIGGQAALTAEIENYPAVGLVEGPVLMHEFKKDAEKFGCEFMSGEVTAIARYDDVFALTVNTTQISSSTVIVAFGLTPRSLEVQGEKSFYNKGVYHSVLDAAAFAGKDVAVIGGGNSALLSASMLAPYARTVSIVHRRDQLSSEAIVKKRLEQFDNIKQVLSSKVVAIEGIENVTGLTVALVDDESKTQTLSVTDIIVNIGFGAKTDWLQGLVEFSDTGHIITNKRTETKTPGLFAAGDVTDVFFKQIVISAGEGAKAGLAAWEYIKKERGIRGGFIDWGIAKKDS